MNETKLQATSEPMYMESIADAIAARTQAKKMGLPGVADAVEQLLSEAGIKLTDRPDGSTAWSSATAPGPDGMQHCIAVPGMPSAARDTATITYGPKVDVTITEHNEYGQPVLRGPFTTPAPVQQAAPSDTDEASERAAFEYAVANHGPGKLSLQTVAQHPGQPEFMRPFKTERTQAAWWAWQTAASRVTAPAQPAGLSEQDKLDAARYRWLMENPKWTTRWRLQTKTCIAQWRMMYDAEPWGEWGSHRAVIDAAILAAKEAP